MADKTIHDMQLQQVHFDEDTNCRLKAILPIQVKSLMKSIDEEGLIQPVVCFEYLPKDQERTGKKYKLVAGYRRFKAHMILKKETIFMVVDNELRDPEKAAVFNLAENLQRVDLNILEEATSMQTLKDAGHNEYRIAERVGKSKTWVRTRFTLLKLPLEIQHEAALGWIKESQINDLHIIFVKHGKERVFAKVRTIKEAKQRGENIKVITRKPSPFAKRKHTSTEIITMMAAIKGVIGQNLALRALAWAGGQISDYDMHCSIQTEAEARSKTYLLPYTEDEMVLNTTLEM